MYDISNAVMSSDEKESEIMRCLDGGVAFYIVKPVNPDDLKNVWQYAIAAKKGKFIATEHIRKFNTSTSVLDQYYNGEYNFVDKSSPLSSLEEISDHIENYSKKKRTKKGRKDDGKKVSTRHQSTVPRKSKVVWTNSLHTCFLMAIRHLGLDSKQFIISLTLIN